MKNHLLSLSLLLACIGSSLPSAATEIAVIVNPKNPATKMFAEQASQFFLGKSASFTPVDLGQGSALRSEFYEKVTGKDGSQVKAIWSKIVFTGKGVLPVEYANSAEVKKAVAANPNAIGYIEKSAVDDSVKVVMTTQ